MVSELIKGVDSPNRGFRASRIRNWPSWGTRFFSKANLISHRDPDNISQTIFDFFSWKSGRRVAKVFSDRNIKSCPKGYFILFEQIDVSDAIADLLMRHFTHFLTSLKTFTTPASRSWTRCVKTFQTRSKYFANERLLIKLSKWPHSQC